LIQFPFPLIVYGRSELLFRIADMHRDTGHGTRRDFVTSRTNSYFARENNRQYDVIQKLNWDQFVDSRWLV
jgi:hypothetical protein